MVWEAFRIFWDRLPERDEYQGWVSGCVSGAISIGEVGSFFSQSEEHKELLRTVSQRWLCLCLDEDDDHEDEDDDDVFLSESFHGSSRQSVSPECVTFSKWVVFSLCVFPCEFGGISELLCCRVSTLVCFSACCRAAVTTEPPPCRYDRRRSAPSSATLTTLLVFCCVNLL